jgi:hypothetical protein
MSSTRPLHRAVLSPLERLEGRTLLSASASEYGLEQHPESSGLARPGPGSEVAPLALRPDHAAVSDHNPLRERDRAGLVLKQFPHFYKLYKGPRSPGLDARIATAHLVPGRGFEFTGTMAGPIDPTAPASFVFAIDRGGAGAPGPYPQRADIFFDSYVTVATGPGGVSGNVTLLYHSGAIRSQTPLPAQNVAINGRTLSVTVLPGLLPPTSTPRTRLKLTEYRFNLHVQYGTGGPETIASFVPEYSLARFAIPRLT